MQQQLDLQFEPFLESDIPELTGVMTRAFDDDSRKHLGVDRGGPDGYDNGNFFRKWLFGYKETVGYKVTLNGRAIGGLILWILEGRNNIVGTVFVDPDYQDRGVGTRIWRFIEETYPDTLSWRLETPRFAAKNHYFYEKKWGFTRVDRDSFGTPSKDSYLFRREMHPRSSPNAVS